MRLSALVSSIPGAVIRGNADVEVGLPRYNSGQVGPGDLFCAIKGKVVDGNRFVPQAKELGAAAILTADSGLQTDLPLIIVPDDRIGMAQASNILYNNPTNKVILIGVTGTNGKTSSTIILENILKYAGLQVGRIGTLGWAMGDRKGELPRTTPEAPDLLEVITKMVNNGVTHVVMEVTSIALSMKRVFGFNYKGGIFYNLTQDHLDFHHSMEEYFLSKKDFFLMLNQDSFAIANLDDPQGLRMLEGVTAKKIGFRLNRPADVWAEIQSESAIGSNLRIHRQKTVFDVFLPLLGRFNIENATGCLAAALELDIDSTTITRALAELTVIPGRMERVIIEKDLLVIVDYAHTPDAIEKVLTALRPVTRGKLWIVFGAGGERDRGKRPKMGEAAARWADRIILTSDNPRGENPETIIAEILAGIIDVPVIRETDRRMAIRIALEEAKAGDTLLIAGKGGETYQEIQGQRFHFDDREEVLKIRTTNEHE